MAGDPVSAARSESSRLFGIDFSPFNDQQNPSTGDAVDESVLRAKLALMAPHTNWIRTYTTSYGMDKVGAAARENGLNIAMGAWVNHDADVSEREISRLIELSRTGYVDLAIVGSETLYRMELDEFELDYYIRRVKRAVPNVPVGTADAFGEFLNRPALIEAVDVLLVNYYPYQQGISIEDGISAVHGWHQQVLAAAGGKDVVVSESGWPTAGRQIGDGVASPQNAAKYFAQFVSWAEANNVRYFYFKDFDEPWLALSSGSEDAHWGIWDADNKLKPEMEPVLTGLRTGDVWTAQAVPGGPGQPRIEFQRVPPTGSSVPLTGFVWHARPEQYRLAVYVYVGGWWSAPTAGWLGSVEANGRWSCDIASRVLGPDAKVEATRVAAFLVAASFEPPPLGGELNLPNILEEQSTAHIEARVPFD